MALLSSWNRDSGVISAFDPTTATVSGALSYTTTDASITWTNGALRQAMAAQQAQYAPVQAGWVEAMPAFARKRRRIFGKKQTESEREVEAKVVFKLIKKGLSKQKSAKFKALAERAFEEAVQYQKVGQTKVSKDFEKIFTRNLKIAAILTEGYGTMIHEKQVQKYIEHLPKKKELVIDDLDEYEKPIPKSVLTKVQKAKDTKVFDKFVVFWIREVKDPIIFGQITDEPNFYYYIAEWDDDISVDDLLKIKVK